jgi:lipoprotein-releasing system permease protein
MDRAFFKYFLSYIFRAKTRQRLLILAFLGLTLSTFSLIVLQSIMGGLQKGLIQRSKNWTGEVELVIDQRFSQFDKLEELLAVNQFTNMVKILEIELLARKSAQVAPVILQGIYRDNLPHFLVDKDLSGLVLGSDLAVKLKASYGSELKLIAPSSRDVLLGEIPRQVSEVLSDFVLSELAEVDTYYVWTRIELVQNLLRTRGYNRLRFYSKVDTDKLASLVQSHFSNDIKIIDWNDRNAALMWALNLETIVMISLFSIMSLLVSVCIISGYLIFFNKVKPDLMSFWILGYSRTKLDKLSRHFCHLLSFVACSAGLLLGLCFLFILDHYAPDMMPDVFVERRLPVNYSLQAIVISLGIPYLISWFFSAMSLKWSSENGQHFLKLLRSAGA